MRVEILHIIDKQEHNDFISHSWILKFYKREENKIEIEMEYKKEVKKFLEYLVDALKNSRFYGKEKETFELSDYNLLISCEKMKNYDRMMVWIINPSTVEKFDKQESSILKHCNLAKKLVEIYNKNIKN